MFVCGSALRVWHPSREEGGKTRNGKNNAQRHTQHRRTARQRDTKGADDVLGGATHIRAGRGGATKLDVKIQKDNSRQGRERERSAIGALLSLNSLSVSLPFPSELALVWE